MGAPKRIFLDFFPEKVIQYYKFVDDAKQKGIEIAKNAIKIGLPEKQIAEITGLSPESILELKEQSHANA